MMRINIEDLIRNYFFITNVEEWNYITFNRYLRLLGYKTDNNILVIYNTMLSEFENHTPHNNELHDSRKINSLYFLHMSGKENYKVFKLYTYLLLQ